MEALAAVNLEIVILCRALVLRNHKLMCLICHWNWTRNLQLYPGDMEGEGREA